MTSRTDMPQFLPTTREELAVWGWSALDVILVTGDTYIDTSHIGVAVIGRVLLAAGYRVGLIAQPDIHSARDIGRLGEPRLFWGVTGGSVDSMIANFTPSGKRRRTDDMTPGGQNDRRPDRAVIAYSQLIQRHFKNTKPIVLGGIEASLRRISHYDAWSDRVRRSILFDAKADYLLYGMADQTVVALADALAQGKEVRAIRGLCYISPTIPEPDLYFSQPNVLLPSHEEVRQDAAAFSQMFALFYTHSQTSSDQRLCQRQDTRFLVHNPPAPPPSQEALDAIYELPYARAVHPYYQSLRRVAAMETIPFALTTHRGCFGQCRFCAITVHQGRQVISRSQASLLREAAAISRHPDFKGIISDVGGPTANMYGMDCTRPGCHKKGCVFPKTCRQLNLDHGPQIELLRALRGLPGIRKVFVASGLRYDLILADRRNGLAYLEELLRHHTSGQLKIAPEHIHDPLLQLMGKPDRQTLEDFIDLFDQVNARMPKKQFLTYYFMAAHPGCTLQDMAELREFARRRLRVIPEQVQIFTPSPATFSTLMYHIGIDPFTGQAIFVEKSLRGKIDQKKMLAKPPSKSRAAPTR
ncbi:MAG: YgiQ family radical SAM protein [Desulfobacteraceae bacterium]|nr:YgiQ family radical SAM protein [Desulfobacteraceae bacterium]